MTAPGCGAPAACPVPDVDPARLTGTISCVWEAGTSLRRGHRSVHAPDGLVPAQSFLPPPQQMSRFAPVLGAAHSYVARREPAALLESVLHDAVPGRPRVPWHALTAWSVSHVVLSRVVRLIDLRAEGLARMGMTRDQLITTDPSHYPCTRPWAARLQDRHVGGRPTEGMVWSSRQAELHAATPLRPLLEDVLAGEQTEVAVLWPDSTRPPLLATFAGPWPLEHGRGHELMVDVANLLGAPGPLDP